MSDRIRSVGNVKSELPKRARTRLARAELWLHLACTAERWAREVDSTESGIIPFADWPADDPFVSLCRTYELTPADLARACSSVAAQAESKALAGGYADALSDSGSVTPERGEQQ